MIGMTGDSGACSHVRAQPSDAAASSASHRHAPFYDERMHIDHLTCRQVVELLSDYIDGVLDDEQRDELERHLVACEGCLAYLDQLRAVTRVAGSLQVDDVPVPMMDALLEAFRREH